MSRFRVAGLAIAIIAVIIGVFLADYSAQNVPLTGTSWRLVSIDGKHVPDGNQTVIEFGSEDYSGHTECNGFYGNYANIGNRLSLSGFNTDIGCGDIEDTIFDGLYEGQWATIKHGRLTIAGSHVLVFEPEDKR